ncbi:MAG: sensor histidine kinase [Thermodesulfobacteriota bacterium]|nr:sensor histidine kinase [Thermodesulfobacteriota bacterium]
MTASISHEIKNVLAIINETAGLLEDTTLMAEKGKPVDPERIKTLAGKIMNQVQRADGVVKNMNKFAHGIDETFKVVDIGKTLEFVAALAARFASMRGVVLETELPARPVTINTSPFVLQNLIWLCLDFAMDAAGEGKIVTLIAEETKDGPRIRFTRLQGLSEAPGDMFPSEQEKALLGLLQAELSADLGAGVILLSLSKDPGPPKDSNI